ncbi:GAF domain-containing protein [Tychonema sp. LEGE 07199]|uniref:ATP-binding protein n=1 Tax=unclassified Tychonema TaxID=2642144 RepID=UPI00187F1314|nr:MULTISPECIES: ATP-binding protein [unclassified Tychonema]MBE9123487.1 GAF domain-containing protein [Tychonema sp. LEGE 07199]MBE9131163.1 GAF domain-containing protein [Tychonema sp. LEGE 07196]
MLVTMMHDFYDALAHLATYTDAAPTERQQILKRVETSQKKLKESAHLTPIDYQHKFDLVEAELRGLLGQKAEAMELYDRAITGAKANEYVNEEALACELAAKFYLSHGREKIALVYMIDACDCYARCGDAVKIEDLKKRYPQLLSPILPPATVAANPLATAVIPPNQNHSVHPFIHSSVSRQLSDFGVFSTLLKACQALSSEIELDRLIAKLMQLAIANIEADKVALLLPNGSKWEVAAASAIDSLGVERAIGLPSAALDKNSDILPLKIVDCVKNLLKPVIVRNIAENGDRDSDSYIQKYQPQSLLCWPILERDNLVGILYLENRLTAGVFTRDRLQFLNLLCSQAAISLSNAILYQKSQDYGQQLERLLTKFSRTENQLAEQKQMLQAILDVAPIWIWMVNPKGKVHFFNNTFCKDVGSPLSAFLAAEHYKDILGENAANCLVSDAACLAQDSPHYSSETLTLVDGKQHYIEVTKVQLKNSQGETVGIIGLGVDATDRKQADELLQKQNQQLEQTLKDLQQAQLQIVQSEKMSALGNLVAGVAHEINNPIGFISGNLSEAKRSLADVIEHLELYRSDAPKSEMANHAEEIDIDYLLEDLPKMIDSMQVGCDRISSISTSLRTFSRGDKDYKVPFNIHDGINSAILILKHRLKANEYRPQIEVITKYGNLPKIQCFPGQLNQVFMNLLANAIDALEESNLGRSFSEIATNPNRITICTEVLGEGQIQIKIADNGTGMQEEIKKYIFDHLFTTKCVGKGTGLGLTIAHQIAVEKHGGSIEVSAEAGVGTEFAIVLPVKG